MTREMNPCIYILTNEHNAVLYTGVTSDLAKRLDQHLGNPSYGFSGRYKTKKLVYVELCEGIEQAIKREKQIKGEWRQKKVELINKANPEWKDLSSEFLE